MDQICSSSHGLGSSGDPFHRPTQPNQPDRANQAGTSDRFNHRPSRLERYVPSQHPLRPVRAIAGDVLFDLRREIQQMRAQEDRFSVPPERVLKLQLLKLFFSIATDHLLLEQLRYNLLFLWFIGFDLEDPIWSASLYVENSARLLRTPVAKCFLYEVFEQARRRNLLEDDHFNLDASLSVFVKGALTPSSSPSGASAL